MEGKRAWDLYADCEEMHDIRFPDLSTLMEGKRAWDLYASGSSL